MALLTLLQSKDRPPKNLRINKNHRGDGEMISDEILKKSVEHIQYEYDMLKFTYFMLAEVSKAPDQMIVNVLLESFSIHAANLFEFLYHEKKTHPDDISIFDYQIDKNKYYQARASEDILEEIPGKRNKQIAHLTYTRNNYDIATKGWKLTEIYNALEKSYKAFIDSLPVDKRKWFFK